jgi:hypothetical protein
MAKLGLGALIIAQSSWDDTATGYQRYCEIVQASGYQPRAPISLFNILVADEEREAEELGCSPWEQCSIRLIGTITSPTVISPG